MESRLKGIDAKIDASSKQLAALQISTEILGDAIIELREGEAQTGKTQLGNMGKMSSSPDFREFEEFLDSIDKREQTLTDLTMEYLSHIPASAITNAQEGAATLGRYLASALEAGAKNDPASQPILSRLGELRRYLSAAATWFGAERSATVEWAGVFSAKEGTANVAGIVKELGSAGASTVEINEGLGISHPSDEMDNLLGGLDS